MTLSADTLRLHLEYCAWADERIFEAAKKLTSEELARDFNTSDKNVVGTLAHVFAAERIWLARLQGEPRASFISDEDRRIATLDEAWPELQRRWQEWAAALNDEAALDGIAYKDLRGNSWENPVWQIVLHVVNHGTHHRGQASGFMRAMGHTPPPLDLIFFYRSL